MFRSCKHSYFSVKYVKRLCSGINDILYIFIGRFKDIVFGIGFVCIEILKYSVHVNDVFSAVAVENDASWFLAKGMFNALYVSKLELVLTPPPKGPLFTAFIGFIAEPLFARSILISVVTILLFVIVFRFL